MMEGRREGGRKGKWESGAGERDVCRLSNQAKASGLNCGNKSRSLPRVLFRLLQLQTLATLAPKPVSE